MMTPTLKNQGSTILGSVAESYVRLVLAIGEHDPDYVDAYFGPPEWRAEVKAVAASLDALHSSARILLEKLGEPTHPFDEEIVRLRHQYLSKQIRSALSRIEMLQGRKFTFDEEALALYDAKPPVHEESFFRKVLFSLDGIVPGSGDVALRFDRYRQGFVIAHELLDHVFQAAILECRKRTQSRIDLPQNECFTVEYVTNKSWSGYNWFKGNSCSLIQINTDLPIYIDRAIDLAAHEGYPGHHVYNTLLEKHLAQERGWLEFTVYALFSPQSLIAEGTANFGIEVAFPGDERVEFERTHLFPVAGLNSSETERYYAIHRLTGTLNYAHNEAARGYLDGKMNREQAEEWLVTYALMSPERAKQRVRFIDAYRSYVINYNLGQDLVRNHIESRGGTAANPSTRWEEFKRLISSPRLPSGL
jgi:hypothetical protein